MIIKLMSQEPDFREFLEELCHVRRQGKPWSKSNIAALLSRKLRGKVSKKMSALAMLRTVKLTASNDKPKSPGIKAATGIWANRLPLNGATKVT